MTCLTSGESEPHIASDCGPLCSGSEVSLPHTASDPGPLCHGLQETVEPNRDNLVPKDTSTHAQCCPLVVCINIWAIGTILSLYAL